MTLALRLNHCIRFLFSRNLFQMVLTATEHRTIIFSLLKPSLLIG